MARVMKRLTEIRDNGKMDSFNVEKYVRELTKTMIDTTHLGMIRFTTRGIMEHKVITNLRCISCV